jgi:hypothetical protein
LIAVIARQGWRAYFRRMARSVLALLALAAMLLVPFAMAGTSAAAHAATPAAAGHCDDPSPPSGEPASPQMHCTACAALPAMEAPAEVAGLRPQALPPAARVGAFGGIEPDTITPPPKSA